MTTQKKTTIGGQAIIEGIVMKGPKKSCTVVRKANGELSLMLLLTICQLQLIFQQSKV